MARFELQTSFGLSHCSGSFLEGVRKLNNSEYNLKSLVAFESMAGIRIERQFLENFLDCKMYTSRFSLGCDPLCFQNSIYKSTLVRRRNICARGLTCFQLFFLANL